jgi:hypothetical protein
MDNSLNVLARKAGFNTALRHFKLVTRYVAEINDGANLADLINQSLDDGEIERYQVRAILNSLLVEKFSYVYATHNLIQTVTDVQSVVETISKWNNIQFVVNYYHPQAGEFVFNPKNPGAWEAVLPLVKDEFLLVFAGQGAQDVDRNILASAAEDLIRLLYGERIRVKKDYKGPEVEAPAPSFETPVERQRAPEPAAERPAPAAAAPAPAASPAAVPSAVPSANRRITPRYSVVVTNELFHNGNVEAWKKIIDSYRSKYGDLDVLIWYENERINDINALFKWGKVKHGTPIMFSVAGSNIRDVSKLQRYLFEGASPRFESFLRGGVDRVLDLF